jgi:hypothetical protein
MCFVWQKQSPCKSEDAPLAIIYINSFIKALYLDMILKHERFPAYARDVFKSQKMKQLKLKAESVQKFNILITTVVAVWTVRNVNQFHDCCN